MSYTPTTWQTGDTITAEKLNHIEQGLFEAVDSIIILNGKVEPLIVTLTPTASDLSGTMDVTPEDVDAAVRNGNGIMFEIPMLGGIVEATQFLLNTATQRYSAHANIVYNPGAGDALVHIGTNTLSSSYDVTMFPLTPMS